MLDFNTNSNSTNSELADEAQAVLPVETATHDDVIERIAKLVVLNTPVKQIALATGIKADRIDEVIESPRVQERVQAITIEQLEADSKVNRGWDGVEEEALGTVLETLMTNPDPDYALKAAAIANKAQRRGAQNNAINGKQNASATIELNINFVEKLQSMRIGMTEINQQAKRVDSLAVQDVHHLFRADDNSSDPLMDFVQGVTIDGS